MGVVFKARQIAINKFTAVKLMHAHLVSPESLARFQAEARTSAMLDHPYIVRVQDFGMTNSKRPYMVMDFIEGQTLSENIQQSGPLSSRRFFRLFSQICDALSHAHKHSVMHRDIKPSNIMLVTNDDGEEEIRIMDFGIAKVHGDTTSSANQLTRTGETVGSPLYMSPEQSRGQADTRSDLYSLGCVMYECLSGAPPFSGGSTLDTMLAHVNECAPPLHERAPNVDSRIEPIVMKLLEKDPADRYQSMDALGRDLLAASAASASVGPNKAAAARVPEKKDKVTAKKGQSSRERRKATPQLIAIICACTALIVGSAILCFRILNDSESSNDKHATGETSQTKKTVGLISSVLRPESAENTILQILRTDKKETIQNFIDSKTDPIEMKNDDLRLGSSKITEEDLEPFRSSKASYLKSLTLNASSLTDHLLESLSQLKLHDLDLRYTRVADLHALAAMKSLELLDVGSRNSTQKD